MNALYPRGMALCAVLAALTGCSGRTVEGLWFGPMPGTTAQNCRIELRKGGVVEASCKHDPPMFWRGTFRLEGDRLFLHRSGIQIGSALLRGWNPEVEYHIEGPGNRVTLTASDGQRYVWERRLE